MACDAQHFHLPCSASRRFSLLTLVRVRRSRLTRRTEERHAGSHRDDRRRLRAINVRLYGCSRSARGFSSGGRIPEIILFEIARNLRKNYTSTGDASAPLRSNYTRKRVLFRVVYAVQFGNYRERKRLK